MDEWLENVIGFFLIPILGLLLCVFFKSPEWVDGMIGFLMSPVGHIMGLLVLGIWILHQHQKDVYRKE